MLHYGVEKPEEIEMMWAIKGVFQVTTKNALISAQRDFSVNTNLYEF